MYTVYVYMYIHVQICWLLPVGLLLGRTIDVAAAAVAVNCHGKAMAPGPSPRNGFPYK